MERSRKRELRDLNARAWNGEKDLFAVADSVDSSMKKNTAFIKRLRTGISSSATATFLLEIRTLSLHKYLSEIISACYEGLCKLKTPAEIGAGVEIFSALHQRFGPEEFTHYIGWFIGRGLSTPDKAQLKTLPQDVREREEKERINRHRLLLRVATELWLVGGLRSLEDVVRPEEAGKGKENDRKAGASSAVKHGPNGTASDGLAEPFPLEVLKELLGQDSQHVNLPMIVQLVKAFSWDLLGKKSAEGDPGEENDPPMTDEALQQRFRNVLTRYYESATKHLLRDQAALNSQSKRNAEAYVRSGEVFEDRQANFEKQSKAQEKFVSNMQVLADALGAAVPNLQEKDSTVTASDGTIGIVKTGEYLRGESDGAGIWEDEDERRFYENLIDLKDRVPAVLLEDGKKKRHETDEQVGKRNDGQAQSVEEVAKDERPDVKLHATDEQSTTIANKTVGAKVDALLARLPDLTSKEGVDDIAVDFCFVNSKASRNRLIKAVEEVPRGRTDLLPLYSRLVTTLGKRMPDITQALVSHLDEEFRSLQRRKQKDSLSGVRTSNIRYLAELTKFGVVPEHVIFHCLKVSLDDFSKMNIEIICNLLENCGRYLLRNPDTSPRMASFLETLNRKKSAQHLAQQERMLIENAVYYVNPPERAAIEQKERTPIDLFVRKLVYMDLTKRDIEKVAKQIRKLHWEEEEVVHILHKIFVKPGSIKYGNIHFLAIILGSLNRYHQDFTISVIDDVLESIVFGLELNEFKYNQRRLAEVKYLGELYVYKMIDSSIIFDTMFKILTLGHGGWPKPGVLNSLDLPDDFFRIRLICNILDTCGTYYEKGAARKKLDFFLTFFQYYINTKEPMPMDVEFVVQDTFALVRPQWKILTSLEEAGTVFADACKEHYQAANSDKHVEVEEADEHEELEDEEPGRRSPLDMDDKSSGEEIDAEAEEQDDSADEDSDEEEQIIVTRPEDERDPEADAEFDRELAKMMAESLETRKSERRPTFDVALPIRKAPKEIPMSLEDTVPESSEAPPNTIKFSLLSKKGNRPQTRAIDMPADSNFAVAMRTQQEAEKAEQQRIKKLVLNYDLHNDGDVDGEYNSHYILEPNVNRKTRLLSSSTLRERITKKVPLQGTNTYDRSPPKHYASVSASNGQYDRTDRHGGNHHRGTGRKQHQQQQSRKLQLSDVDWT